MRGSIPLCPVFVAWSFVGDPIRPGFKGLCPVVSQIRFRTPDSLDFSQSQKYDILDNA
jgi:hypothetical protein